MPSRLRSRRENGEVDGLGQYAGWTCGTTNGCIQAPRELTPRRRARMSAFGM